MKAICQKIFAYYNENTTSYIKEEVIKVREEFETEIDRKIEISFNYQVKHIVDESLKEFNEEVNNIFIKEKNIENIKALKPKVIKKFEEVMNQVCYKQESVAEEVENFSKEIDKAFNVQKEKIVIESLKDFDRSLKKQV